MSDRKIKIVLVIYIIMSLILFIGGLAKYTPLLYLPVLNMLSAAGLVTPWLKKYLHYPHRIEPREVVFLCVECLYIIISIFFIVTAPDDGWLFISQYIIAALHLLAAIAFFVFMLVFKIKKLF
jgi:hypothetical protein